MNEKELKELKENLDHFLFTRGDNWSVELLKLFIGEDEKRNRLADIIGLAGFMMIEMGGLTKLSDALTDSFYEEFEKEIRDLLSFYNILNN